MQSRTRLSMHLDRLLPTAICFFVCFFFYLARLGHLLYALGLALLTAALFWYGLLLFSRRNALHGRQAVKRGRLLDERALLRMDEQEALLAAFEGLKREYSFEGTEGIGDGGLLVAAYKKEPIVVALSRHPDEVNVRDVEAFDRLRGEKKGVLIGCAQATKAALAYAGQAEPPLCVIRAASLPLRLEHVRTEAKKAGFLKRFKALLDAALRPERDLGYMQAALFLMILFIATDRLLYLVPGLLCALLGTLCRGGAKKRKELF